MSLQRQVLLVGLVMSAVAFMCIVISREKIHGAASRRMGTGAGQSAAAGQGAQDTGKWDAAGEPLLEKCIDLRAECAQWEAGNTQLKNETWDGIGAYDKQMMELTTRVLFKCQSLNTDYMKLMCRRTCGLCGSPAPAEYDMIYESKKSKMKATRKARLGPAPRHGGLAVSHPILALRPVVLAEVWPLLEEFFALHSKTFKVRIDKTCTHMGPQHGNGGKVCEYYWKIKTWNCRAMGRAGGRPNALYDGWQNPQCEEPWTQPDTPGEQVYRSPQLISSTTELQWHQKFAAEAYIPLMLEGSEWETQDAELANATLVQFWVACLREHPAQNLSKSCHKQITLTEQYKKQGGHAYFFPLTSDYGPCSWTQKYMNKNTFVPYHLIGNQGMNSHPCFDRDKDITVPTSNALQPALMGSMGVHMEQAIGKLGGIPQQRDKLAFFLRGTTYGARSLVYNAFKDDEDMYIVDRDTPQNIARWMLGSKFCVQADGNAPWSPRLVQYMFCECVPVFITDDFLPPFFDILDWAKFSITIPTRDLRQLKQVVEKANHAQLRDNLRLATKALRYQFGPKDYSTKDLNALPLLIFEMWRKVENKTQT